MKYFEPFELVSPAMFQKMGDGALSLIHPDTQVMIDGLREFFGKPITVNNWKSGGSFQHRGARTPEEAAALGAPHSMHTADPENKILCRAIDFDVQGMKADDVRDAIIANKDNPLLQKITRLEANVTWVHADTMPLPPGVTRIHLFHA